MPVLDPVETRPLAVASDELLLRRDAELVEIGPVQAVLVVLVRVVGLADVAEVGERVAEGRELPVEDRDNAGPGGVHDGIAEPIVAVHHHRLGRGGDVPGQPFHERVHLRDVLRAGRDVLLAPARDLPFVVVAGPAEGAEPHFLRRDRVQRREHVGEVAVDGRSLGGRRLGHEGVRVDPALHLLHHVELGADDARVVAQEVHPRHRDAGRLQRLHDPVLPVHRVGGGEELARRLLAQHVLPVAGREEERRVALPALELPHHERLADGPVRQLRAQIHLEGPFVEAVSGPDRRQHGNVAHLAVLIGGRRRMIPAAARRGARIAVADRPAILFEGRKQSASVSARAGGRLEFASPIPGFVRMGCCIFDRMTPHRSGSATRHEPAPRAAGVGTLCPCTRDA